MADRRNTRHKDREQLVSVALQLFLEQPKSKVTLAAIGERFGSNYWHVARIFKDSDVVYRAAVSGLMESLGQSLSNHTFPTVSVAGAISAYVDHAAEVVQSEAYRQLLYLIIRDACEDPWLKDAYERKVSAPLRTGLVKAVQDASAQYGGHIVLRAGAPERFLRTLESALTLPKLLPGAADAPELSREAVVASLSRDLMAQTFSLEFATEAA